MDTEKHDHLQALSVILFALNKNWKVAANFTKSRNNNLRENVPQLLHAYRLTDEAILKGGQQQFNTSSCKDESVNLAKVVLLPASAVAEWK